MVLTCEKCGGSFERPSGRGQASRRYCGDACAAAAAGSRTAARVQRFRVRQAERIAELSARVAELEAENAELWARGSG